MITITGKTALITGSSRGIGRGIALKLASCGVNRIGVHYLKNQQAAEETASQLRQRGAEALLLQADVTKLDDIAQCFRRSRLALALSISWSAVPDPISSISINQ